MCSRYYIDGEMVFEIKNAVSGGGIDLKWEVARDIRPSEKALVLAGGPLGFVFKEMRWGFLQYQRKGLLINARVETVLEKKTFRESVLRRRCVVPAKHFYEWDSFKNKVTFFRERPVLYMAGFFNRFQEEDRFVILTTQANDSVNGIHDRMPLILEEDELERWVYDDKFAQTVLKKIPARLQCRQEYEQMSLF